MARSKKEGIFTLSQKEILALVIALIVLAFSNAFVDVSGFLRSAVFFAIILVVSVLAKKGAAYYFEIDHEEKIWSFKRYGFKASDYFKNEVPIGILLPIFLSFVSLGYVKWFAVTMTDLSPRKERAVRRHGFYSFAELTEWHIAMVSAASIVAVMILSFIAYNLNFIELAKLCVYFSFFNLIPLGKLDGTRILFGSKVLWILLVIFVLSSLGFVMMF